MNAIRPPVPAAERLSFDSEAWPRAERLRRYREINAGGAGAVEAGPAFRAKVDRWRLDRLVLHERHLHDVIHEFDPATSVSGFDHFMLTLVVAGRYEVDCGRGYADVGSGNLVLLDMTRAMRSRATRAHVITTSLARAIIGAAAHRDDLHGTILEEAGAGLIGDFMQSLTRRMDTLPVGAMVTVSQALAGLIGLSLGPWERVGDNESTVDAERVGRVRRMIEQRLAQPDLGPETVIADTGLSRATLYRLFSQYGGLASYIQRRRLDRVRVALSDPGETRPLAAIAGEAGFASESHCSRQFHKAFGLRPGEYRAKLIGPGSAAPLGRRLDFWHDELR